MQWKPIAALYEHISCSFNFSYSEANLGFLRAMKEGREAEEW